MHHHFSLLLRIFFEHPQQILFKHCYQKNKQMAPPLPSQTTLCKALLNHLSHWINSYLFVSHSSTYLIIIKMGWILSKSFSAQYKLMNKVKDGDFRDISEVDSTDLKCQNRLRKGKRCFYL